MAAGATPREGGKTETGPRAGRTSRSRHSVVLERGADRSLVRGGVPPTHYRPPRVRQSDRRPEALAVPDALPFSSEAVRGRAWHLWCTNQMMAVGRRL